MIKLKKSSKAAVKGTILVICDPTSLPEAPGLLAENRELLETRKREAYASLSVQQLDRLYIFAFFPDEAVSSKSLEKARVIGAGIPAIMKEQEHSDLSIINQISAPAIALGIAEGAMLGSYRFDKYLSKPPKSWLQRITLVDGALQSHEVDELVNLTEAVCMARDLVNEPQNVLTATELGRRATEAGKTYGFKVEVFNKKKIESLKMGGILSVNQGSPEPPAFITMEWKPEKPVNKKPLIFVGKGVVYDTGGLSLKPTPSSMDMMKCDMAGGAAAIATLSAIAANQLPLHVVGLVPASDNRPGLNAYAPGDIITMFDGTTVEVLNTDAEGRLLLADALAYAKKYKPELVIEASTLTGAAVRALGEGAIALMSTADEALTKLMKESGEASYERLVEFPLWEEFGEEMKSPIADLKNLGGPYAGQITAGKFLEHFTSYPFMHCDIAGPAFLPKGRAYLTTGGTGVGVRLFYDFCKRYINR